MSATGRTPSQTSLARVAEFGVVPKRSLGQNFLIDDNILGVILERLEARPDDVVIEVGAGLGVLTGALARVVAHVHAFEIDRSLEAPLRASLAEIEPHRLSLHFADILDAPLEQLDPVPTLCASNLPYSIAGPFLAEAVWRLPEIRRYCVMMQKEVADRLASPPGSKAYGGLSVWVQLHARVVEVRPLSRSIFYPRPNVDSSLLTLDRVTRDDLVARRPRLVRQVIDAAFSQRRKRLANAVCGALPLDKQAVAASLAEMGLDESVRAEQLPPEGFVPLAAALGALLPD